MAVRIYFLLLVACFGIYAAMNINGYCWPEKRWLSDQEILEGTINYVNSRGPDSANISNKQAGVYDKKRRIAYKNSEEFLKNNPDCCQIHHGSGLLIHKVRGLSAGYVEMKYKVLYNSKSGKIDSFVVEEQPGFSNCGDKWYMFLD